MKQRTISREATIKGKALHTGDDVHLTLKPAAVDTGVVFRRMDLYGKPEIRSRVDFVTELVRSTTISSGYTKIHTVEHVLSALHGLAVDNVIIEMDASEPPIMDGSARAFVALIQEAGPVEQDKDRVYLEIDAPVSVIRGNSSIVALPSDTFKISCTSTDDRGIHTQHLSLKIDPDVYVNEICSARTFTVYEEIEELLKMGKIRGGSLENAVVLKGDKILSKEPLRFKDEFVRHKILDIIGDVFLLGIPLKAHIIAMRPGHAINSELTRALAEILKARQAGVKLKPPVKIKTIKPTESSFDIGQILETIPHRYPFVLIDRIIEIVSEDELIALKNVTINEPFFQGHFPGKPVMPGVLQLEAMAQAAGILMLRRTGDSAKVAFFMSADKVKFRKPVVPGDQLVIYVKLLKLRGKKIATAEATCKVNDQTVSSAELMFTLVEPGDAS